MDYRKVLFPYVPSRENISFPAGLQKPPQPFPVGIAGEDKSLVMASFDLQKLFGRNS
jgi:hypothetical protein